MRILHVLGIGKLPRNPDREAAGGTTRVALEIARVQALRGHDVVVATLASASWRAEWNGVQLLSVRLRPSLQLRAMGRKLDLSSLLPLILLTTRHRFDVIHAHECNYLRYLPAALRVTHFHNDPSRFPADHATAAWEAKECLAAARYSHAHIAVSGFVARQLRRLYEVIAASLPATFDADRRIHVVHNGTDLARFDPDSWLTDRLRIRSSWGVAENEVVLLYSGAMVAEKGLLELTRAFSALSRIDQRVRLVLAGDAALWADDRAAAATVEAHTHFGRRLNDHLAELTQTNRVLQLGMVAPAEMPAVYAAADVAVLPSVVQEACPLSALEALAMGKPLVASAVGGLVEFATSQNSLLVSPGNGQELLQALQRITADRDLRARLATAARPSVFSYTWERTAVQVTELYRELLQRKRSIVCASPPAFYKL